MFSLSFYPDNRPAGVRAITHNLLHFIESRVTHFTTVGSSTFTCFRSILSPTSQPDLARLVSTSWMGMTIDTISQLLRTSSISMTYDGICVIHDKNLMSSSVNHILSCHCWTTQGMISLTLFFFSKPQLKHYFSNLISFTRFLWFLSCTF